MVPVIIRLLTMILWQVALVFALCLYGIYCPHQHNEEFQCYHCDPLHTFPHCEPLTCRHDEICLIRSFNGIEMKCAPKHECHHEAACSLVSSVVCEKCCTDGPCVNTYFTQLVSAHQTTIQLVTVAETQPTTTTTTTPTPTPNTGSHPFLKGMCADELVGHRCMDTKKISCKNHEGISLCAETCGLCGLLREKFGNNGTCRDQVVADECRTHTNICTTVMAEIACPVACNMCDTILENLFDKVSKMNYLAVVKPPVTVLATTAATTTMEPCFDNHDNCAALNNPCNNVLAGQICRKFCNLCSSKVVDHGILIG